jgi:hypothetical protein
MVNTKLNNLINNKIKQNLIRIFFRFLFEYCQLNLINYSVELLLSPKEVLKNKIAGKILLRKINLYGKVHSFFGDNSSKKEPILESYILQNSKVLCY